MAFLGAAPEQLTPLPQTTTSTPTSAHIPTPTHKGTHITETGLRTRTGPLPEQRYAWIVAITIRRGGPLILHSSKNNEHAPTLLSVSLEPYNKDGEARRHAVPTCKACLRRILQADITTFLTATEPHNEIVCCATALTHRTPLPDGFTWLPIDCIYDPYEHAAATAAWHHLSTFQNLTKPLQQMLHRSRLIPSCPDKLNLSQAEHKTTFQSNAIDLRLAMAAHPSLAVRHWGERITLQPPEDIPLGGFATATHLPDSLSHTAYRATHPRFRPSTTLPIPPERTNVSNLAAWRIVGEIARPEAWATASAWWDSETARLDGMAQGIHTTNSTIAISAADATYPDKEGLIYNIKGPPPYFPYNSAKAPGGLNGAAFAKALPHLQDKELLSILANNGGVVLHANIPHQVVLCTTLGSMAEDPLTTSRDAAKLERLGYISTYHTFPWWPIRINPQGLAAKPDGTWRRVCDGGCPRNEMRDSSGIPVPSLNDAARKAGMLPKEQKPTTDDLATDLAILSKAGEIFHESVFGFTFDFEKFFYQFKYHPYEHWKVNFVSLSYDTANKPQLHCHTELAMSMGVTPASNIAQRFANVLANLILERFDALDAPTLAALERAQPSGSAGHNWFTARHALTAKLDAPCNRLHTGHIYTDDGVMGALAADRTARLLGCTLDTCAEFNISLATDKGTAGQLLIHLGISFAIALGILYIPPAKVARAAFGLDLILSGEPTRASELRQLAGLLQHFRNALRLSGLLSYGLYQQFGEFHLQPAAFVTRTTALVDACKRWMALLERRAIATFAQRLDPAIPSLTGPANIHIFSDASQEGLVAGLGGVAHGYYWYIQIRGIKQRIIAALELLALIISVRIFHALMTLPVEFHVDNRVITCITENGSASNPLLQAMHLSLAAMPTWRNANKRTSWLASAANILADATSRPNPDEAMRQLCATFGVRAVRLQAPHTILDELRHYMRLAGVTHPGGGDDPLVGASVTFASSPEPRRGA